MLINKNIFLLQVKLEPLVSVPAEQLQLNIDGITLVDHNTLESYNITSQSTIQITP